MSPLRLLAALCLLACMPAHAHGFGARYDLPLPLALWIGGAASTVLLSFLVAALAARSAGSVDVLAPAGRAQARAPDATASAIARLIVRLVTVAALVLVVAAGLFGDQTPTRNLAPTAVWIAWWIGFSYVSAFVGDVWSVANPWAAIFEWCEPLLSPPRGEDRGIFEWPQRLGAWPGIALFLAFAWVELIWDGRSVPSRLAGLVIAFSLLAWSGMFLFGRRAWVAHADPFALAFGVLSRFSPSARTPQGWILRPPGVGLLRSEDITPSLVVFVIVMLSTVTFDGLMATPFWQRIQGALYVAWPALGGARLAIIDTLGLLGFCALFVAVYRAVAASTARASMQRIETGEASRAFVLTLVPIAIGYLVAHYLSYCLIQGQLLVRLASDPFGFGWNLFGTAGFRPDVGIVGARFVWYTSLLAIVIGHVAAVALAHTIALRRLGDRKLAVRSQFPMLVLMVAYTMMSLWIIAQPIVE